MQLKVGEIVEGKIVSVKEYGAFVNVGDVSGMVHISEVANDYVTNINDFVKVDDVVKVKVLNISDDGKLSFSIKKASADKKPAQRPKRERASTPSSEDSSSYTWAPKKSEPASFEEMLNRFKATSDEKFSDLKRKNPETKRSKRGANSR